MRFTPLEIKQDLLSNTEDLEDLENPDYLSEIAESYVPVYYADIIKDWTDMPNVYDNSWRELRMNAEVGIVERMQTDLNAYYLEMTQQVARDILEERK
jgi:hypothetical protein